MTHRRGRRAGGGSHGRSAGAAAAPLWPPGAFPPPPGAVARPLGRSCRGHRAAETAVLERWLAF